MQPSASRNPRRHLSTLQPTTMLSLSHLSTTSSLLNLPAEIIEAILKAPLVRPDAAKLTLRMLCTKNGQLLHPTAFDIPRAPSPHSSQILRVLRQLCEDGRPILYSDNEFEFSWWCPGHEELLLPPLGAHNVFLIRHLICTNFRLPPPTLFNDTLVNLQSLVLGVIIHFP